MIALGLAPLIGFSAAAWGTTIAGWVMLWQLWHGARNMDGAATADARLRRALPRIALACLAMAAALWFGDLWLADALATSGLRYAALALLVLIGMATYAAAILATGALRLSDVKAALRRGKI